jgi:hypothetical protein
MLRCIQFDGELVTLVLVGMTIEVTAPVLVVKPVTSTKATTGNIGDFLLLDCHSAVDLRRWDDNRGELFVWT